MSETETAAPPAEKEERGLPADVAADRAELERAQAEETEARARRLGWKDKHEFDRPPERWVDAKTFIERGEAALPVLRENFHRVEQMLGATQAELRAQREDSAGLRAAFEHMSTMAQNAEARAFERAKRDFDVEKRSLEARIDQGAAAADVAAVRTAREALATLREPTAPPAAPPRPQPPAPQRPGVDPAEQAAVQEFTARERWFVTAANPSGNSEATEFAGARYGALQREAPGLTHQERLAKVRESVEKRFPELFRNERRTEPPRVAQPTLGANTPTTRASSGWNDIPAEDRAVAQKMIDDVNRGRKDGKTFTRDEYAATYFKGQR